MKNNSIGMKLFKIKKFEKNIKYLQFDSRQHKQNKIEKNYNNSILSPEEYFLLHEVKCLKKNI
jgi:hypothetical protein